MSGIASVIQNFRKQQIQASQIKDDASKEREARLARQRELKGALDGREIAVGARSYAVFVPDTPPCTIRPIDPQRPRSGNWVPGTGASRPTRQHPPA